MMNNTTTGLGFLAGVGCGAGIALLVAPRTGRQTRALIAEKARAEAGQLKEQATGLLDSANGTLHKQKDSIQHAVKAGVQAFQEPAT